MRISVSRRSALLLAAAVCFSMMLTTPALARDPGPPGTADPNMICTTCDGGGGGDTGGGGSGGGDMGGPAPEKILDVWARAQINGYYCGPASGQVIINFTRGIFKDAIDSGENANKNWATQSQIAGAMGTTRELGTTRSGFRDTLNAMALTPGGLMWKAFAGVDTGGTLHDMIVHDIWDYSMPLALAVNPHDQGNSYWLPSYPDECNCQHWIAVNGYDGFWRDDPDRATVSYAEPRGNGGQKPGPFAVDARTLWKVNRDNQRSGVWLTTP